MTESDRQQEDNRVIVTQLSEASQYFKEQEIASAIGETLEPWQKAVQQLLTTADRLEDIFSPRTHADFRIHLSQLRKLLNASQREQIQSKKC